MKKFTLLLAAVVVDAAFTTVQAQAQVQQKSQRTSITQQEKKEAAQRSKQGVSRPATVVQTAPEPAPVVESATKVPQPASTQKSAPKAQPTGTMISNQNKLKAVEQKGKKTTTSGASRR